MFYLRKYLPKEQKVCQSCNKTFSKLNAKKLCKDCSSKLTRKNAKQRAKTTKKADLTLKQELVNKSGGKCIICGYNKFISALQFHHIDPHDKSATVATLSSKYKLSPTTENYTALLNELDKCILLCANCHAALHNGEITL